MPYTVFTAYCAISADITGNPNVGFTAEQLDGDFDPASYDEAMARTFDDGYYMVDEEGEEEGEEGKPEFSDDDGELVRINSICRDW